MPSSTGEGPAGWAVQASPFLIFALLVQRAATELASAAHVPERTARAQWAQHPEHQPVHVEQGQPVCEDVLGRPPPHNGQGIEVRYDGTARGYIEESDPRYAQYGSGREYVPLMKYQNQPNVLFIHANEISSEERNVHVPSGHYEWVED